MPYPNVKPLVEQSRKNFRRRYLAYFAATRDRLGLGTDLTGRPATDPLRLQVFQAELAREDGFKDRYGYFLDRRRKEGLKDDVTASEMARSDIQSYRKRMTDLLAKQPPPSELAPLGTIVSRHGAKDGEDIAVAAFMPVSEPEPVRINFIGEGKDGEAVMEYELIYSDKRVRLAHLDGRIGKAYTRRTLQRRDGILLTEAEVVPAGDVIAYASGSDAALHREVME